MAIETKTSVDVQTLPPFKRFIMSIGALPTSYLESMSYAELLMWFCNFLQEQVIPAVNNNADAIKEIQEYLQNLDLQDEVDNKLDEMAESGQLQEIIADYLNSKAVFGFDNVASLKEATNLINGSYAETYGYYAKNDNGKALYKIRNVTNEDVVDDMIIIALNDESLVAELICDEYNLASLGATDEIDISSKLQEFMDNKGDNITIYVPEGTYLLNIILKNKNMKIYGKGTIKGSIEQNTSFTGTSIPDCFNEINGIKFTKDENEYAIKLQAGRNFKISNVVIDNTFTYGIYYNYESAFAQRINRVIISNNYLYSKYGLYLKDTSVLGCADISFENNILYSEITNVYLDGIDGFKDNNNTYFMPGHSAESTTKEYNFIANRIVWLTINGSTFFEAGYDAIHLTKYQNVNISNNIIGWCGQRVRSAGIYLGDYDVSGSGLYNLTNVTNNIINAPSGNGITATTNTGRICIDGNRLHAIGSSQYYYGPADTSDTYGIYYPLINENMYTSVTNNICENKISSISTRIFHTNNIVPNSKATAYRLTEDVTVNDTFTHGVVTTKTLSYTIPTGYVLNNIRVKSIDPSTHTAQYTITIIGSTAVIINNYSSNLTTTFVFEVEYVKSDSFV